MKLRKSYIYTRADGSRERVVVEVDIRDEDICSIAADRVDDNKSGKCSMLKGAVRAKLITREPVA